MAPKGSGAIRRCGFAGGSMSLWEQAFEVSSYDKAMLSVTVHFLMPVDQDVEL